MSSVKPCIRIDVNGPLNVAGPDGTDLTPVGAKNQALLAILALSPKMTRPRRWLEDKLWSTFGPEQASANLRQALSKLRRGLGDCGDLLTSDRSGIGLDPQRVQVDVLGADFALDTSRELLEGLDVRDPEFDDWLRDERSRLKAKFDQSRPSESDGVILYCHAQTHGAGANTLIGDVLANQIGENITEQVRAWRRADPDTAPDPDQARADMDVSCDLAETDGKPTVFIKVTHSPSGRILFSKLLPLDRAEDVLRSTNDVATVVFEAADRVLGKLPLVIENGRPEARATALSRLALYRMFSFEGPSLAEADGLLRQAFDADPNGVYLAWRGLVRTIQLIELTGADSRQILEEITEFSHRAMELSSDNPLAQSLVGHARVMALSDSAGASDLAEQAVARSPCNAFTWQALSAAKMLAGDPAAAFDLSQKARTIARFSPFRQWWDLYHCIVAIACNKPDMALEAGEAAARAAPSFRPAHRHLLALYTVQGQHEKAMATAEKLTKIEPGFTLDRFINDESYPVRTLRNKGLLEPLRALL
ncbi:transcriptional regulator [Thalassococcus profundi]|mgnify:FL=1|uniref:Transcriptional regulator n=1 Tax=Thalassococcus profundi TaxID=2282382 RepID=A0A369TIN9_9RHOB|nr:transcriptional regulator [Thalassococcus profundi]RDD65138.1 transcriptional regulator [Thalassococcus profundi]